MTAVDTPQVQTQYYDSTVFFLSLSYRLNIKTKPVRIKVKKIFGTVIDAVLQLENYDTKLILFQQLIPIIRQSLPYLEDPITEIRLPIELSIKLVNLSAELLTAGQKIGRTYEVSNKILNQAFTDDLVCDIGVAIKQLKTTESAAEKLKIKAHLQVLLSDYNFITNQNLTVEKLLRG
jgi:hypothetical protein